MTKAQLRSSRDRGGSWKVGRIGRAFSALIPSVAAAEDTVAAASMALAIDSARTTILSHKDIAGAGRGQDATRLMIDTGLFRGEAKARFESCRRRAGQPKRRGR